MLLLIMASSNVIVLAQDLSPSELIALSPVLKDHMIRYTDPMPSNVRYSSVSDFNPRGMHHVYAITHTFLDLIQRDQILPASLNATHLFSSLNSLGQGQQTPKLTLKILEENWEELLLQYIGLVTAGICGLLMALAIPLAGFCVCCCRCAGKCGAYPEHFDKRGDACKRLSLGIVLSSFVIAAMFGVVTAFVTNGYANEGLLELPQRLSRSAEDAHLYIEATQDEVKTLLVTNFDELESGLNKILDESGPILKANLAQVTQAVAIDNLADIVSGLGNVKRHLRDIQNQTQFVKDQVTSLTLGLGDAKGKLLLALGNCSQNEACRQFMQEYEIIKDLAVAEDFQKLPSELPDVSLLLQDIADLMNNDIEKKVRGGQKKLDRVKTEIESSMVEIKPDIKREMRKMGRQLEARYDQISAFLENLKKIVGPIRSEIPKAQPILDEYGVYVYYIGLGMSMLVLIVLTCHILGLFYGFCGKRPGNVYGDDCCNRGTGANWLLAAVYLTFLFSLVLLALTTILFLVGASFEKLACQSLENPEKSEIFEYFDEKFIQPRLKSAFHDNASQPIRNEQLTLRHLIGQCHNNETLYRLLNLENVYNVEKLKNWREEYGIGGFINGLKNKIQLDDDLRNIQILSPQAEKDLVELAESQLSDLDLSQYTQLMQERITDLDLSMFITKLKRVRGRLDRSPQVRAAVNIQILFLEQMQKIVISLESGMRRLADSVELLERDAQFNKSTMREALQLLIKQASTASKFLRTEGPKLVDQLANSYVNETIGQIDDYVERVVNLTQNHIGKCGPLSNSFNATVVAVCNEILDPFNGFWASVGWCYLFYLPSIALAICLVSLYRKSEPYPGPLVEVQPEDVGPSVAHNKKKQRYIPKSLYLSY